MATTGMGWADEGLDLHLLPGLASDPLKPRMSFCETTGRSFSPPADVSSILEFIPNFKRTRVGNEWRGPGVTVDAKTGVATATPPPATGPRLRNFLVHPVAGSVVGDPIRIHLHESIDEIWLSPNPMTVRKLATAVFTILARFDDGVVGDITNWPFDGVVLPSSTRPAFTWTPAGGPIEVASNGTVASWTDQPNEITCTVTLPAALGGHSASAKARGGPAWDAEVQANLVPGGSDVEIDDRKNFLFVSDGFAADERKEFEYAVQIIVDNLRKQPWTQPYGDLKDSMNFWSAFVPSPQRGVTQRDEFRLAGGFGQLVEMPRRPGNRVRDVTELFHEVGLPVPTDDSPGVPMAQKTSTWNALYESPRLTGLTPALYDKWRRFAKRALVNDVDSAFGIGIGTRPSAANQETSLTDLNPFRTREARFEEFLDNVYCLVKETVGAPVKKEIGKRWIQGGPDERLVAILSRANTFGGQALPLFVGIRTVGYAGGAKEPMKAAPANRGLLADPKPFPATFEPPEAVIITCAHEWAHSLGLKDEYGEITCSTKASPVEIDAAPNLQALDELVDPAAPDMLLGSKIKWNWPRIRAAAVLADKPAVTGTKVTLSVRTGHAKGFEPGKKVRLRRRRLTPPPDATPTPADLPLQSSILFEVDGTPPSSDTIVLKALGAFSATDAADFPKGSVAFVPAIEKTATAGSGAELGLVAPAIAAHITSTGGPLNAEGTPPNRACDPSRYGDIDRLEPANLPDPLPPTRKTLLDKAEIVGLYEGGGRHGCGVYHPAGTCTFRGEQPNERRGFCRVCRYAVVDAVDPSKHPLSDDAYADYYPGPEHE